MNARIFIGVGSNIDPEANIPSAATALKNRVTLVAASTFYRTVSRERPEQSPFLNGVFEIESELNPRALKFDLLRPLEAELGRRRSADRYAAREIDLDILVYGSLQIDESGLHIPDPDIWTRPFVATPLLELAPDWVLPDGVRLDQLESARCGTELAADTAFTQLLKARLNL